MFSKDLNAYYFYLYYILFAINYISFNLNAILVQIYFNYIKFFVPKYFIIILILIGQIVVVRTEQYNPR